MRSRQVASLWTRPEKDAFKSVPKNCGSAQGAKTARTKNTGVMLSARSTKRILPGQSPDRADAFRPSGLIHRCDRQVGQLVICCLLLVEYLAQKLVRLIVAENLRPFPQRTVSRDFVVFDGLASGKKSCI